MESTLSAQEPSLLEALDFRIPSIASYVTSREEVVFVPSGNVFAPTGRRRSYQGQAFLVCWVQARRLVKEP